MRRRYEGDIAHRIADIRAAARHNIVDLDVFGLEEPVRGFEHAPNIPPLPRRAFQFETLEGKVNGFMAWLQQANDRGILEVVARDGAVITERRPWQNTYVRTAYQRGLADSIGDLRRAGQDMTGVNVRLLFTQPFHADRLAVLYTRNFEQLRGITEAMSQQIGRVLAEGIVEGIGPRAIARSIADRVNHVGITRARVMARTELINTYSESTLNAFQTMGVEEVGVIPELSSSTAGDERVCKRCEELARQTEANPISIDEARGLLPLHPQCRCRWTVATIERRQTGVRRAA